MRLSIAFVFASACFSMPPRPQLTASGDARGSSTDGNNGSDGFAVADAAIGGVNIAFVTSAPPLSANILNSLFANGANVSCQEYAMQYSGNGHISGDGLPGDTIYVAWVAQPGASAPSWFGNARGWVRFDGLPVADTLQDLIDGKIMYPIAIDDTFQDRTNDATGYVITGANTDGTAASTCNDYNTGDPTSAPLTYGRINGTTGVWTTALTMPCTTKASIYCFGTKFTTIVTPPPVPEGAKLAFITSETFTPGGGIVAANALCKSEGGGSNFVALLATSTASASSLTSGQYYRPDNVTIGELANSIITSINVTTAQDYLSVPVWTGASAFTSTGDATCGDWTSTSGSGDQASTLAGTAYFAGNAASCGSAAHLYCIQQ